MRGTEVAQSLALMLHPSNQLVEKWSVREYDVYLVSKNVCNGPNTFTDASWPRMASSVCVVPSRMESHFGGMLTPSL